MSGSPGAFAFSLPETLRAGRCTVATASGKEGTPAGVPHFTKRRTPMTQRARFILPCLLVAAVAAACDSAPTAVAPEMALHSSEAELQFNPQPDPPMPQDLFRFTIDNPELIDNPNLIDDPNLRPWIGRFVDRIGVEGVLTVEHLSLERTGETLQVRQAWTLALDGFAPTSVVVQGTYVMDSGRFTLSGRTADGATVQIGAWRHDSGGSSSLGGELMFNPQPDPPMPIP
jgi:hypothetical protein